MSSMEKVRIGVIGIGNMGSAHAANLYRGKIEYGSLAAVCDISAERLSWAESEFPDVRRFSDYKELVNSGCVDAVVIATPHYFHPPIAVYAFEHGLHVLTEKPAGVNRSAVLRMNEAAAKSGKRFGIMFNQRTDPLFIRAKQLVSDGVLGSPKRLTWIITNWYRTQSYYDSGSWRGSFWGEGGGVLLNQAPHNLDIMQWIFGMPNRVYAVCDEGLYHNIEVEDRATLIMNYENGAEAQFITTTGEYPGTNRLEIVGDRGKLVIESGKLTLYSLGFSESEYRFSSDRASCGEKPEITVFGYDGVHVDGHAAVLSAFADAVLHGGTLVAEGDEGINMLTLANAAYLSSWTKKAVDLPMDDALFDRLHGEKVGQSKKRAAEKRKSESESQKSEADGSTNSRWKVNW